MTTTRHSRLWHSHTVTLLLLLALTGLGFTLAEAGLQGIGVAFVVLLITLVKGRLVIDRFMGLARVARHWRMIMMGYLLTVLGLVGVAYGLAL
ncbi:MAG: cytochrome C oxidase subunit IV family protein [Candidatus Competibacteraceae bacterium]|nr:cytochrome C oxidase subunit IV family protein [Candidatus Competibacteraceae bacterium]